MLFRLQQYHLLHNTGLAEVQKRHQFLHPMCVCVCVCVLHFKCMNYSVFVSVQLQVIHISILAIGGYLENKKCIHELEAICGSYS